MRSARSILAGVAVGVLALIGWLPKAGAAQWWKLAWTFDVKTTRPQRVAINVPGAGAVRFMYLTYEVTNRSLREVQVVPLASLVTDTFKTYRNQTQPDVKALAERREGTTLRSTTEMMGMVKQGESRRGIIIFREVDPGAKRWDIYISGLSGEYVLQLIPGRAEPLVLHKTYHVQYRNRGDEFDPRDDEIEHVKTEWTYR